MVLRKEVAIFDWEWDRIRDGQKMPCSYYHALHNGSVQFESWSQEITKM